MNLYKLFLKNYYTLLPNLFKEKARFRAIVLLPTPPLQLDTAIILLTFSKLPLLNGLLYDEDS